MERKNKARIITMMILGLSVPLLFGQPTQFSSSESSTTQRTMNENAIVDFKEILWMFLDSKFLRVTKADVEHMLRLYKNFDSKEKIEAKQQITQAFDNAMRELELSPTNYDDFIHFMTSEVPAESMFGLFVLYAKANFKVIKNDGTILSPKEMFTTQRANRDSLTVFYHLLAQHREMENKVILESSQDRSVRHLVFYAVKDDWIFCVDGDHYLSTARIKNNVQNYKYFLLDYKPDVFYASEISNTYLEQKKVNKQNLYPKKEVFSYIRTIFGIQNGR